MNCLSSTTVVAMTLKISLTDVMGSYPPYHLDVDMCMLHTYQQMYSNMGALPYLYNYTHLTQGVSHSEVSQSLSNLSHYLLHHILLYNETTTSTIYLEGEREGGREGEREGEREREWEGEREGEREREWEGEWEGEREGEREREWEGEREEQREEREWEGENEGGREGERVGGREGGREREWEGGKEGGRERGRRCKEMRREAI